MPLPLFFVGAAVVTGVVGAKKAVKAGVDNSNAKSINESAQERIEFAKQSLNKKREATGMALDKLGELKMSMLKGSINAFLASFEKIKNVDYAEAEGLSEFEKLHIDENSFIGLRELSNTVATIGGGVAGGAITALGAYGAVTSCVTGGMLVGGVTTLNATLAFLGGGAAAATGGLAAGAAIFGGVIAGPALLVMGIINGSKASANLDNAYANSAKADEICEQLETVSIKCEAIRRRAYLFYNVLTRLDAYFLPLIYELENVINKEGVNYKDYSTASKKTVAAVASLAGTIKTILDTSILTEEGVLTDESENVAMEVTEALYKKDNNSLGQTD